MNGNGHKHKKEKHFSPVRFLVVVLCGFLVMGALTYAALSAGASTVIYVRPPTSDPPAAPMLDKTAYDMKLLEDAFGTTTISTTTLALFESHSTTTHWTKPWPVKTVYPNVGAILPFHRIVAYYGNFYSTAMGVLGEYPAPQMLSMLQSTVAQWQAADPSTPVIPAIDYIAVTAQGSAGADGMYRARMPDSQIEEAIGLAKQVNGLVILDIQVGLSNVQTEVPLLKKYLELPNVEIAIDPEFSMKDGVPPGREIGTYDAKDINWVAQYLAQIVKADNLPPKILVVHRFTEDMVTNYKDIEPLPQVEIVMDMDGWGSPQKKVGTYTYFIEGEPVQFTGFKLFYKNDTLPPSSGLMIPAQVLKLTPQPLFIQYQ